MRLTELLKAAGMGGESQPQIINKDGKQYEFRPGENGSLTVRGKVQPKPVYEDRPPVAKTIPAPKIAQTGSVRG